MRQNVRLYLHVQSEVCGSHVYMCTCGHAHGCALTQALNVLWLLRRVRFGEPVHA